MKRYLVPLATLMLITGCAGGLRSTAPATQSYILRATPAPASGDTVSTGMSLQIARLTTDPGLGSDRIVLVESDHRMGFYAASRWAAELPDLVETLAVAMLRATGEWDAVYEFPNAFATDYLLQIAIRRFEADYTAGGNPTVQVTLDCTVVRRSGRDQIANFVVQGSAPATENRLAAVVAAFERAANEALSSMAQKTAEVVRSAKTSTSQSTP
jgi:cholesterol transport system auxiliary component